MTKHIKIREVEKSLYKNFLLKAIENYDTSETALKEGSFNAAAVSAVHSAISAAPVFLRQCQ